MYETQSFRMEYLSRGTKSTIRLPSTKTAVKFQSQSPRLDEYENNAKTVLNINGLMLSAALQL